MSFERFNILKDSEDEAHGDYDYPMLINLDHIVSIKPIRILSKGNVINGHWIRTVNDKKYRATRIPKSLEKALFNEKNLTDHSINCEAENFNSIDVIDQ